MLSNSENVGLSAKVSYKPTLKKNYNHDEENLAL